MGIPSEILPGNCPFLKEPLEEFLKVSIEEFLKKSLEKFL